MSAITAKASRKMKKYAVLTREPRCFLGSFDFSWEQRKAIDIADYSKGNGYSKGDLTDAGTPIILYGRLYTKYRFAISEVDTFAFPRNGAVYSQGNEVIVPASGETAEDIARASAVEKSGVLLGGDLNILRPFDFINPLFLALAISNGEPQKELAKKAQGKSVVHIHNTDIQEVTIAYPSRTEQDRIVSVFRQLDNLITLHQRKCANLCSPSQVVFSLLFATSTFSWEQRKAKEICSIGTGKSNTQDQVDDGKYPFYIRSDVPVRSNKYLYDCEAVITIGDGNIGKVFHYVNGKFDLHQRCYKMTDFKDIWGKYFFYYFSTKFYDRAMKMTAKATVDSVRLEMISEMDIKKPPQISEQKQIAEFFANLDNLITLHQRECISFTGRADRLILTANKKRTTSSWEQRKLSEITDKVTEKNAGLQYVETFTNSAEFGIISQRDFFDHDIAKLGSLDGYYIVKNEDFVYNPRISTSAPVGPINRNKLGRTGVMSPLYTVFRPHDIDTTYLEYFFKCGYWHSFMNFNGDSGARSDRFSIRDNVFFQMPIPIPDIDEQRKIGELLTCLDNLITLHQRKPFLMKWRTSDANRNQTNRLVL